VQRTAQLQAFGFVEILGHRLETFPVDRFDTIHQGSAGLGQIHVVDPPVSFDIQALYKFLALELVEHRSDTRTGNDKPSPEIRLCQVSFPVFQDKQDIELGLREPELAEKGRAGGGECVGRSDNADNSLMAAVFEGHVKVGFALGGHTWVLLLAFSLYKCRRFDVKRNARQPSPSGR